MHALVTTCRFKQLPGALQYIWQHLQAKLTPSSLRVVALEERFQVLLLMPE